MIFHVFLYHPSLQWNEGDGIATISKRLMTCREVALYVKNYPEAHELLFWKEDFLGTTIDSEGVTIKRLLLNPKEKGYIGKTLFDAIMPVLKTAKESDVVFANLAASLEERHSQENEQDVGLLLCEIESPFQTIVQSSLDILNLHVNIIMAGRFSADKLRREGKYVFDRLIFSSLKDADFKNVAKSHPKRIMEALKVLNNCFPEEYFELLKEKTKDDALEEFGITHEEIDGCSSEAYESSFDIEFELKDGSKVTKRCTPHLKLDSNDLGQSRKYARIYFALPSSKDEPIYVGRIIPHAETKRSKGKKKK